MATLVVVVTALPQAGWRRVDALPVDEMPVIGQRVAAVLVCALRLVAMRAAALAATDPAVYRQVV